jgi:hypothetical protein
VKLYIGTGSCTRLVEGRTQVEMKTLALLANDDQQALAEGVRLVAAEFTAATGWENHRARMHPVARHQVASWLMSYGCGLKGADRDGLTALSRDGRLGVGAPVQHRVPRGRAHQV